LEPDGQVTVTTTLEIPAKGRSTSVMVPVVAVVTDPRVAPLEFFAVARMETELPPARKLTPATGTANVIVAGPMGLPPSEYVPCVFQPRMFGTLRPVSPKEIPSIRPKPFNEPGPENVTPWLDAYLVRKAVVFAQVPLVAPPSSKSINAASPVEGSKNNARLSKRQRWEGMEGR
jgi:hypothetical protein